MSLEPLKARRAFENVPRASGDEPVVLIFADELPECSPRERG